MIEQFLLPEENYSAKRQEVIENFINSHKTDETLYFRGDKNCGIHYEWLPNPEPKYTVMISHGFVENAQKFHEVAYYFYMAGCSVCLIDQIGHGDSFRYVSDKSLVYVEHFSDYVEVLDQLITEVVLPRSGAVPVVLYGHSMGGCITAMLMFSHPDSFAHVILSSPMIRPLTMGFPMWLAKLMAKTGKLFGKAKCGIFGQSGYDPEEKFADSPDTSEARFLYNREVRRTTPNSQNSHPTYGWALESFYVDKTLLDPDRASAVTVPVTLFIAEDDTFVSIDAERKFAALLPKCEAVFMSGTKHEIYMSENTVLTAYWEKIYEKLGLSV